jgi:hypothetical protein
VIGISTDLPFDQKDNKASQHRPQKAVGWTRCARRCWRRYE